MAIKAYLAAPIFTERDRNFNAYLEAEILKRCPEIDLYLAQNNKSINDKTGCADSIDIYVGDVTRLKQADLVISIMSGDLPPIGSSYETAYFCALCENNINKKIIALYDDCRDGYFTYSEAKKDCMISGVGENQWPYINLLSIGYVKKNGDIYHTSDELIEAIADWYKLATDERISGIYKITNLKNNLVYIGQSIDLNKRWMDYKSLSHKDTSEVCSDMAKIGIEYFKFEIIEKCDPEDLDVREKYWIKYYDSYNAGYNREVGGSGIKGGPDWTTKQTIKVYAYNLNGTFARDYNSIAYACRDRGLKSNNITRCLGFNDSSHQSGGYMWRLEKRDSIEPFSDPIQGKKIFCYDKATRKFIKGYDNGSRAGFELTGKRQPHINDAATGARPSCLGMLWAYDYFDRLPVDYYKTLRSDIINECDSEDEEEMRGECHNDR